MRIRNINRPMYVYVLLIFIDFSNYNILICAQNLVKVRKFSQISVRKSTDSVEETESAFTFVQVFMICGIVLSSTALELPLYGWFQVDTCYLATNARNEVVTFWHQHCGQIVQKTYKETCFSCVIYTHVCHSIIIEQCVSLYNIQ